MLGHINPGKMSGQVTQTMKKSLLIFLLKLALTVGILAYLFSEQVRVRELFPVLARVSFALLGLALTIWLGGNLLRTWRWQIMLRLFALPYRYHRLLPIFFIGTFFSAFTPGTLGADAARVFWTRREQRAPYSLIIGSIVLERAAGLLALLCLFVVFSLVYAFEIFGVRIAWFAGTLLGLFVLAMMVLAVARLAAPLRGLLRRLLGNKLAEELDLLLEAIRALRFQPAGLASLLALSFLHEFSLIGINWVLAQGLHIPISLGHLCLFVPAINLLAALPATINGIGIREASYLALFNLVDIDPAASVSLSLVYFLVTLTAHAVGGLVFLFYRQRRPVAQGG